MMMSDYSKAGYLENNAFLKQRPTVGKNGVKLSEKSYADVYDHVMRRIVPAQAWSEYFSPPQAKETKAENKPAKIKAVVGGKEVIAERDQSGKYYYSDENGDLKEYKPSK
jgi:hypothetical protein